MNTWRSCFAACCLLIVVIGLNVGVSARMQNRDKKDKDKKVIVLEPKAPDRRPPPPRENPPKEKPSKDKPRP